MRFGRLRPLALTTSDARRVDTRLQQPLHQDDNLGKVFAYVVPFLSLLDAIALRQSSRGLSQTVQTAAWSDDRSKTMACRRVASWIPNATRLKLIPHLRGAKMSDCWPGLEQLVVEPSNEDVWSVESVRFDDTHFRRFTALRSLGLSDCNLQKLASTALWRDMTTLQTLDMREAWNVGEPFLNGLTHVRCLNMWGAMSPNGTPIDRLPVMPHLEELHLGVDPAVESLAAMASSMLRQAASLRSLHIGCNDRDEFWTASLDGAFSGIPRLTSMTLQDFRGVVDKQSFQHVPDLRHLVLGGSAFLRTEAIFAGMTQLRLLNLRFFRGRLDKSVFNDLRSLRMLDVHQDPSQSGLCRFHDVVLQPLKGLECLVANYNACNTFSALHHMTALHTLMVRGCLELSASVLQTLTRLRVLDISECTQLSRSAIEPLHGLTHLYMASCYQPSMSGLQLRSFTRLRSLDISDCYQPGLDDGVFASVNSLRSLTMRRCNQSTITDEAFASLPQLERLNMDMCNQHTITDGAFAHLGGLVALSMTGCDQPTITDAGFVHLTRLRELDLFGLVSTTITRRILDILSPSVVYRTCEDGEMGWHWNPAWHDLHVQTGTRVKRKRGDV